MSERESLFADVPPDEQIERLRFAVATLAWWLVQAQTGFGVQDARGIEDILNGKRTQNRGD